MGENLIDVIAEATGLPKNLISEELKRLISAAGKNVDETSLEDIREILAEYVENVLVDAKEEYSAKSQ